MNLVTILSLLTVVSNWVIASILIIKGNKKFSNILFACVALALSIWAFGCTFLTRTSYSNYSKALFWHQLGYTGAIFIPVFYAHFVFIFLNLERKKLLKFVYFVGFIFVFFNWYNEAYYFYGKLTFIFDKFYWHSFVNNKDKVFLWVLYVISFYFFLLGYTFFLLIKEYINAKGFLKNQLKYLIFGSALGWIGGELHYLPNFGIYYYPLLVCALLFTAVYPFIITYGILKHHLMDINIVFKKGLVYSILATVITAAYLIFVIGIGRLFQGIVGYQSFAVNLIVVFIIAILFNPLRDRIQHFLDKRFFQGTLETLAQERERLKQELFQTEKLAYVGQMASAIVHEIRNPLTVIETHLEYLPKKYEDPEFKRKFEHLIPKEIDRIKKVVNQLLGLAKPRKPIFKPVNITNTIDSTLLLLENNFKLKKINVKKEYEATDIVIQADEEQLRQVFLNLFLNSIQAMSEEGTLTVGVDLRPSALDSRESAFKTVIICVKDNGKGMTEETKQKLFTPFSTTKPDGIGLGLVIIKEIIEAHKGSIEVESELERGTRFVVELPICTDKH